MRVLKHPICFISLFNPFSHVVMSDGNPASNFRLTSGHYIDWHSLLSYTYMAILLPYMVGGGGGRGPHSLIHKNVCHVCDFISAAPLNQTSSLLLLPKVLEWLLRDEECLDSGLASAMEDSLQYITVCSPYSCWTKKGVYEEINRYVLLYKTTTKICQCFFWAHNSDKGLALGGKHSSSSRLLWWSHLLGTGPEQWMQRCTVFVHLDSSCGDTVRPIVDIRRSASVQHGA